MEGGEGGVRERVDVRCGGKQHGGDGDEGSGDADSEYGCSGAHNHDAASEPDSDSGTDGELRGDGGGYGAAKLPVAEERSEHRWGNYSELHDGGDNDFRQRIDVRCGGEQHGRDGDEFGGDADGEYGCSGAHNNDGASEPDGDGRTDGELRGGGGGGHAPG